MKKRIIAFLLTITMLLSAFNTGMVVFSVETDTDVTITVLDSNGKNIDNCQFLLFRISDKRVEKYPEVVQLHI